MPASSAVQTQLKPGGVVVPEPRVHLGRRQQQATLQGAGGGSCTARRRRSPTRSCATTKSSMATTSEGLVQGVNGSQEGRISIPWRRSRLTAAARVGGGVPLVQDAQRRGVDRLEGRHDEQAAGLGQVGPQIRVREDVLDLGGAVEAQIREGASGRPGRPAWRAGARSRSPGRRMSRAWHPWRRAGPRRHDDVLGHDTKPPVVDDRQRAVPATVRAAVAGLHGARQSLVRRRGRGGRSSRAGAAGLAPASRSCCARGGRRTLPDASAEPARPVRGGRPSAPSGSRQPTRAGPARTRRR